MMNKESERSHIWLRGFYQGNYMESGAINQDKCPERAMYFGKRKRMSSIWGKLSLTSQPDNPDGNVQEFGHRCKLSDLLCLSFLHCKMDGILLATPPQGPRRGLMRQCSHSFHTKDQWELGKVLGWSSIMLTWKQSSFEMKVIEGGGWKSARRMVKYSCNLGSQYTQSFDAAARTCFQLKTMGEAAFLSSVLSFRIPSQSHGIQPKCKLRN